MGSQNIYEDGIREDLNNNLGLTNKGADDAIANEQSSKNIYEEGIREDLITNAKMGMQSAVEKQPDVEAKLQALAKQYNLPVDTVRLDPKAIERKSQLDSVDYDSLIKTAPNTTNLLSNPNKAAIAHDDIGNLSALETAVKFGKKAVGDMGVAVNTLGAGLAMGAGGILGGIEAVYKNTGDLVDPIIPDGYNPLYFQADAIRGLRHEQDAWRDYLKPDADSLLGKGVVSGVMSLAQNVPMLAAAVATRNPSIALGGMSAMVFGQTYGEDTDLGLSTPVSTVHGLADAAVEYVTEKWGINKLFGDLKAGSSVVKTVLHQVFPEVFGEQAATALQGLNSWTVQHPERPIKDYIETMPMAAAETLIATMVSLGGTTAVMKTVEKVQGHLNTSANDSSRADQQAASIEQINQLMEASKVLQRDPAMIHDFITQATDNGSAQNFYINANTLQQSGMAEKLSVLLPDVAKQLMDVPPSGEVTIPIADFATRVSTSDIGSALVDHLRVDGEDYTRAQARDYMNDNAAELQAHVDRVMNAENADAAHIASRDAVKAQVLEELNATGRFSPTVNEFYATIAAHRASTRAAQLGILPEEMHAKQRVGFVSEGMDGNQFNQSGNYPLAHRDEWYGEGTFKDEGGRMVHVTPDEYLAAVKPLTMDDESRENIDLLKEHIINGNTLDPLLIRANGKEDGRHRAYAAKELGISHVPVIDYGNHFKDAPEVSSQTYKQSVSTRLPSAVASLENPLEKMLVIGLKAAKMDPKAFAKNTEVIRNYINFRDNKSADTPDKIAEQFIKHAVDNLLWLHDQVPEDIRSRSKLWYDGAKKIADRWAVKYGISDAQVSGVLAVLSPQKDWFQNVSLAERVLDILTTKQDFLWSDKMTETAESLPVYSSNDIEMIAGKKLGDLDDNILRSKWLRVYDQTYNERGYRVVTPEGTFGDYILNADGKTRSKTAWGSFSEIGKAVSVFYDSSIENISASLGEQHKVRNFYNNIFDPNSKHGDVTIDTHAVAAALLRPLSGGSLEVTHNFGSGGVANSSIFGSKGTYGIYAEAYRRAAKKKNILPREMQSITWEAVRELYTASFKSQAKNVAKIEGIWEQYKKRRLSLEDTRKQILEAAGGIDLPEWNGSIVGIHDQKWNSSYSDELYQASSDGGATRTGASGLSGNSKSGTLNQSSINLALVHNLSLENLLHANKLGGIPVPSVAVVNKDHPMDAFGEITLIANKDNLGPQASAKNRFFNADIYSPRYPNVSYIGDQKAIENANSNLSETAKKIQEADDWSSRITAERLDRGLIKGLGDNLALQYQYLEGLGKAPALTYKPKTIIPKALQKYIKKDIDLRGVEFGRAALDEWNATHPNKPDVDFDISASIRSEAAHNIEKARRELKLGKVIDTSALLGKVRSKIDQKEFNEWLTDNYSNLIKDEKIFDGYTNSGNRKYLPHNLDTVVKLMTKTVRGGENFNYGVGSIRAHAAKQFKTIKSLQDAREDLISDKQMDELKDEINSDFESLTEALAPYRNEDAGYSNQSSEALADLASKGLRGFKEYYEDVPEDVMTEVYDFMNQLRNMPSHYFEGKIGRAVGIHEFDGAIVPKGKGYEAAVSLLKERGITNIKRYDPRIDESRAKALGSFNDLFFQNNIEKNRGSFNPSTNIIAALHDADLSTILHELGHFFFENDIALAAELIQKQDLTEGEQSILDDMSTVFTWQGIQGTIGDQLDQWYSMSFEEQRSFHEKTAESFEHYTFTGKAPSMELQRVFDTFRSWLTSVYKSIKDFLSTHPQAASLTPEVRGYFDRMLATSEQIKLAEQGRSMMPLFSTREEARMTEAEFAEYQALGDEATNAAISALGAKANSDMQWMSNARSKQLKMLQREHDALRRDIRSSIRTQVMSQPVYQAWAFLTKRLGEGDKITEPDRPKSNPAYVDETQDSLFVAIAKLGGLKKADIEGEWGLDPATRSPMPVFGKHVLKRNGGVAIDDMGQALLEHGYLAPDEFGRFDHQEFEEKFGNELRGQTEYSSGYVPNAFDEYGKAGRHIINPWGLEAGRIELIALKGMMLEPEIEQRIIDLKMTAKNGLDPDIVSEIIDGFSSGDDLVRTIAAAESPRDMIDRLTDQKMLEDHSELATPEARQAAADEAIHNKVRARFVTREANALAQAAGTTRLLASAAKEYASTIIRSLKIRDIKPQQYVLAQARAAKASLKASKAGDLRVAASEKRNQAISMYASQEAYDALDNTKKIIKYFKKFSKDNKKIDIEYLNQIRSLLAKFDLSNQSGDQLDEKYRLQKWVAERMKEGEIPVVAETMLNKSERAAYVAAIESRGADGELIYMEDSDRLLLLAAAIDNSATRSYKESTYEELLGLNDTVKQIEHMGRFKNRLLTTRDKLNLEQIVDKIVIGIVENGGKADKNVRDPTDTIGKIGRFIKSVSAQHIKVATWARVMDGGKDNGPVWRYIIMPANKRASQETEMKAAATKVLSDVISPLLERLSYRDKSSKGIKFASLNNESLNWQDRFSFLLNMGNESNLQRLMAGGIAGKVEQLSMAQIMEVVSTLSPDDIRAAQSVWDIFESYRPLIAEKELRVSGVEPNWIPVRAIDIRANDGSIISLTGGYFPVKFDSYANMMSSAHASAQDAKDLMKASYSAATTNRSFTKDRVQEVHGRPLMLGLTGLYSGINDIIHDLAWHEWVIDANKLLKSPKIDIAIREHYGSEAKQEFMKWRDDIVAGQKKLDHGVEKWAAFLRQKVSMCALTFNLMSAAMQPLGISNSMARIGADWVAVGVARYAADPVQATKDAQEKSTWMRNRTRTQFRELNELRNKVQGQTDAQELMGRYGYWLMMRTQMMVDVPTWWGGYEKAIAAGHDEDTAIALADQGVKDSQGGGEEVDQSGIERGHAVVKLFTSFYGFMGTTLNVAFGSTITETSKAKIAANLLLTLTVPVVLGHFLKSALTAGGDDDDDKNLLGKLIREQFQFIMGTMVVIREFAGLLSDNDMDYSGPVGLRVIPDIYKFSKQAGQAEFDDAFRKQIVNLIGDATGIPSVQINRTITGTKALVEGKTDNPLAIGFGFR